jgi:hypothetical protein
MGRMLLSESSQTSPDLSAHQRTAVSTGTGIFVGTRVLKYIHFRYLLNCKFSTHRDRRLLNLIINLVSTKFSTRTAVVGLEVRPYQGT